MAQLQDIAQGVTDSLRSGNLDEAESRMDELRRQIPLCACEEDRRAAAAIVLEARKLARVHRAQTIQALQSLVRQRLYGAERGTGLPMFQLDG
jgi:hypothetical protein